LTGLHVPSGAQGHWKWVGIVGIGGSDSRWRCPNPAAVDFLGTELSDQAPAIVSAQSRTWDAPLYATVDDQHRDSIVRGRGESGSTNALPRAGFNPGRHTQVPMRETSG